MVKIIICIYFLSRVSFFLSLFIYLFVCLSYRVNIPIFGYTPIIRSLSHWLTVYFSMLTSRNLSYVLFRSFSKVMKTQVEFFFSQSILNIAKEPWPLCNKYDSSPCSHFIHLTIQRVEYQGKCNQSNRPIFIMHDKAIQDEIA